MSGATTDGTAKTTNVIEAQTPTPAQTNGEINDNTSDPLSCTVAEKNVLNPPSPFYKIALTGGPCGGKTTALARLSSYLIQRGYVSSVCVCHGISKTDFDSLESKRISFCLK